MPLCVLKTVELPAKTTTICSSELTPESFKQYGGVIAPNAQIDTVEKENANYGTAIKLLDVSPFANNYQDAPTGVPGKTYWHVFRTSRPTDMVCEEKKGFYECGVLERHPFTTQTFVPLGCSKSENAFLVVVAQQGEDGFPDVSTLKAFHAKGNSAVTYNPGVWHSPMVCLKDGADFAVLNAENGIGNDDCQQVLYTPKMPITFEL
ncbi:ureidoglycolate hydrolase [Dipodascopsis uninucleata]